MRRAPPSIAVSETVFKWSLSLPPPNLPPLILLCLLSAQTVVPRPGSKHMAELSQGVVVKSDFFPLRSDPFNEFIPDKRG